jgi:hypothetical protein
MFEEGKADTARHLELDSTEKLDASSCSSRLATYKESIVTMTGTFNDALSMLEIWFFDESRMTPGYISLTRDWRGLSSCTRLQDLGRIAYSTLMTRRFPIPGISSMYIVFILSQPRHFLSVHGDPNFQYNSILVIYD